MSVAIQGAWALHNAVSSSCERLGLREEVSAIEREDFVDSAAYASLLQRCGEARDADLGSKVYAHILRSHAGNTMRFVGRSGHDKLRFLKNLVVGMYGKCGLVEEAKNVFDSMSSPNEYSWTMLVSAFAHNGLLRDALAFFQRMLLNAIPIDSFTLSIALSVCCDLGDLSHGRIVHAMAMESGLDSDLVVATGLVNLYGKCGAVSTAREIFESIELQARDSHCWNSMIAAYAQHGHSREAMRLFREMDFQGVESREATLVSVLGACTSVRLGETIHDRIKACGFDSHKIVLTAVLTMYGRLGRLDQAKEVFDRMPERTVVPWSALIAAYAHSGRDRDAMTIFRLMDLEGAKQDHVTFLSILTACSNLEATKTIHDRIIAAGYESCSPLGNSLVSSYGKCGSVEDAQAAFDRIAVKDIVSWNSLVAAYAQQGRGREVLELYDALLDGGAVTPTAITIVSVLDACGSIAALERGSEIHLRHWEEIGCDTVVRTSLLNLYGKCGRLENARAVFNEILARDVIAWNAMLAAYAQHGHESNATELYSEMCLEGVTPNDSSFVSILCSMSHGGRRIQDAISRFCSILEDWSEFSPRVEHFACLVDALGRAGWLREAEELLFSMPLLPTEAVCMSLLNACKVHGDLDRAARVAEKSFQLHGLVGNSPALVMLSSILSSSGSSEQMIVDGAWNKPDDPVVESESFIEIDRVVHEFASGDGFSTYARAEDIWKELGKFTRDHVSHSERLAVGLGLISTPPGRELQVVKKSRVCTECHALIKNVSRATGRKIVLRDECRFHHFESGDCSCRDCW